MLRPRAMNSGDAAGDAGRWSAAAVLEDLLLAPVVSKAAGGREKTSVPSNAGWSLTMNSPDMEGVGGRRERDISEESRTVGGKSRGCSVVTYDRGVYQNKLA